MEKLGMELREYVNGITIIPKYEISNGSPTNYVNFPRCIVLYLY